MRHSPDPDLALVLACQQAFDPGWEDAFRALHDRHKDLVHRICLRVTGDAHDALDAAQDAFLLAFRGIQGFRFRSRFSSWLCRIAVHASFEHLRRRRPGRELSDFPAEGLELACPRQDPGTSAERRERRLRVRRALRRLSPHMRQILVLRYFEELSYAELGDRLAIAGGSVRSRLSRAHDALGLRVVALQDDG